MANQKYNSKPYPFNLLNAMNEINPNIPNTHSALPQDFMGSLYYLLMERLTDKERTVIEMRFRRLKTLQETAESLGIASKERARQIEVKALRKLSHKCTANLIIFGVRALASMAAARIKQTQDKKSVREISRRFSSPYEIPVEELGMSNYITGCLKRRDVNTSGDLIRFETIDELKEIRGLGEKNSRIVMDVIHELNTIVDVKLKPISELRLSIRAYNCLVRSGYETVGDIWNATESDLLKIRNLGKRCADEILSVVNSLKGKDGKVE